MIWSDFRDAPAPGTVLAASDDVKEGQALCLTFGAFGVVLTRVDGVIIAYVNICPHQYLPLDHRSKQVMSVDGRTIRCSNHSAGFSAATGCGTEGLGRGCSLVAIPISQTDANVTVTSTYCVSR